MIWKGTLLSIEGLTVDNEYQGKNQAMRSRERPGFVEAQIWGKGKKKFCCFEGCQDHSIKWNSIILKWKKFGTTRTLPSGRLAKLSNQGRRALVREVTKNTMVTLAEHQRSCVEL